MGFTSVNKVMNGNNIILICVFVLHVLCVGSEVIDIVPVIENYDGDPDDENILFNDNRDRIVQSKLYQTINKYYCTLEPRIEGSHLIVYGTRGWTFPVQDVNLTLGYPSADNVASFESPDEEGYLITGFTVILHIDGPGSRGYILDGGLLQENITLAFVSSELTTLRYQFWLYGVRNDTAGVDLNGFYRCS